MTGTGTSVDPYIISTPTDLDAIRSLPFTGLYLQLGNDIDLSSWGYWIPIGYGITTFWMNYFDGKGYTIRNMHIRRDGGYIANSHNLGFIAIISRDNNFSNNSHACLQNMEFEDCLIEITGAMNSTTNNIGIVAARSLSGYIPTPGDERLPVKNIKVTNCHVTTTALYNAYRTQMGIAFGESVGYAYQIQLSGCSLLGMGDMGDYPVVGGICGRAYTTIVQSYIIDSELTIDVTSGSNARLRLGLLGGYASYTTIIAAAGNCYARGCTITSNFSIGSSDGAGGTFGVWTRPSSNGLKNSYVVLSAPFTLTGSSTRYGNMGGRFYNYASDQSIKLSDIHNGTLSMIADTDGITFPNMVIEADADMKIPATYTDDGWDFDNIWRIDPTLNDGYPILRTLIDVYNWGDGIVYKNTTEAPRSLPLSSEVGYYQDVQLVSEEGSTIKYTTDGTDPTLDSTTYNSQVIIITAATTVKAYSYMPDKNDSEIVTFNYTVKAFDLDGSGTGVDPYIIMDAEDFNQITYDYGAHYILGNIIDFDGYSPSTMNKDDVFSGSINGDGFTIKNINYTRTRTTFRHHGIIPNTTHFLTPVLPTFKNIRLQNCHMHITGVISTSSNYAGLLSGQAYVRSGFDFTNIRAEDCSLHFVPGHTVSTAQVGLLFGYLQMATGGGANQFYGDDRCILTAIVPTSSYTYVGGLIGNSGTLSMCLSRVTVNAGRPNSSLQGAILGGVAVGLTVDCGYIGNIFDTDSGAPTYSMGRGNCKVRNYAAPSYEGAGAVIYGWGFTTLGATGYSTSYLDSESGYTDLYEVDLNEVPNANLKIEGTFIGWDFVDVWGIAPTINDGYPYIRAIENFEWKIAGALSGIGSLEDPYRIYTPDNLAAMREYFVEGGQTVYFKLMNDLNMLGYNWYPMDTFNGVFEGSGFNISGLSYAGSFLASAGVPTYYGLFANTLVESNRDDKTTGIIKNVTFINSSLILSGNRGSGDHVYIGTIIGETDKTDSHTALSKVMVRSGALNISSTSYANASFFIGGVVGKVNGINSVTTRKVIHRCSINSGTIIFSGAVTSNLDCYLGAIVGSQANGYSTIEECYARYTEFSIDKGTGSEFIAGGIVGLSNSTLDLSDDMKSVANCFSRNLQIVSLNSKTVKYGGVIGSGYSSAVDSDKRVIDDCYSMPLLLSDATYGGVCGYHSALDTSTIIADTCYYDDEPPGADLPVLSIINEQPQDNSTTSNSLTQLEMKDKLQYVGWDFVDVWTISVTINDGFPHLQENDLELDLGIPPDIVVVDSPCPPSYEGSISNIFLINKQTDSTYPYRSQNCNAALVCTPTYTRTVFDQYCGWVSGRHSSLIDHVLLLHTEISEWGDELASASGYLFRNIEIEEEWIKTNYGEQDYYDGTCYDGSGFYNLAWDKWICTEGKSIRAQVPIVTEATLISVFGSTYKQDESGNLIKSLLNGEEEDLGKLADGSVVQIISGTLKLPDGVLYYGDFIHYGGDFVIKNEDGSSGRVGDVFFLPETSACYEVHKDVFPPSTYGSISTTNGVVAVIGCARNYITRKDQEVLRSTGIDEIGTDIEATIDFIAKTDGVTTDDLSYKLISEGGILYDKSGVFINADGDVDWNSYAGLDVDKPLTLDKYYITTTVVPDDNSKYSMNDLTTIDEIEELYGPEDNEYGAFGVAGRVVLENDADNVLMIQVKPTQSDIISTVEYKQAIDRLQLKAELAYVILTFPANLLTLDEQREVEAYLYTHTQLMNNHSRERGMMLGTTSPELNGTGIDDNISTYKLRADALSNENVSFAVPSKSYRNGILYDSNIIAAALAGAKVATKYVSTPIHGKELLGFAVEEDKYTDIEISQLSSGGCCVARTINGVTRVNDAITTDLTDANTQELSVVAVKRLVKRTLRRKLSGKFFGKGETINEKILDTVAAEVNSTLGSLIKGNEISEYGLVDNADTGERVTIATQNPLEPRLIDIICSYKPLYPLKWIDVKVGLYI